MKLHRFLAVLSCMFAFAVIACGGDPPNQQTKPVKQGVLFQALIPADTTSVVISWSGTAVGSTTIANPSSTSIVETIGLSPGTYTITAQARQASTTIYSGTASSVAVQTSTVTRLQIIMQQVSASSLSPTTPMIQSISFTPAVPIEGQSVSATVSSTGSTAIAWSGTCGGSPVTFSQPGSASTTISGCNSSADLTITATNSASGLSSIVDTQLAFIPATSQGVELTLGYNTYPVISSISGADLQIAPGETVSLTATASDADGDLVIFAWSLPTATNPCPTASLSGADTATVTFTAPPSEPTNKRCDIALEVSDGKGASSKATSKVTIGVNTQLN